MKAYYLHADWEPKEGYKASERERAERCAIESHMVWRNPHAGLAELPVPKIERGEVLVKIGACGVCGTDKTLTAADADGYMRFSGHSKLPLILGHEIGGEVVETGADVKKVIKGDIIAVEQMQWCGQCYECRTGHFNQCEDIQKLGVVKDGGFAEYIAVQERFCCVINDIAEATGDKLVAMEMGALAEPAGVAYNCMFVAAGGFKPGATVAVFGQGALGLASVALARAQGAAEIIAFSTRSDRLELSRAMGATRLYNPRELAKEGVRPSEVIMEITKGVGAQMLVEAAGNGAETYPEMEDAAAAGAKIVQIGMEGKRVSINLSKLMRRMVSIHMSIGSAGNAVYPCVLRLMKSGMLDMRQMVTGRYKIEEAGAAIEDMRAGKSGKLLVGQLY